MIRVRIILWSAVLAGLLSPVCARNGDAAAPLPPDSASVFKLRSNAGDFATMSSAPVSGQPFKSALHIAITKKPPLAGDVLLASFSVRPAVPGETTLNLRFQGTTGALFGALLPSIDAFAAFISQLGERQVSPPVSGPIVPQLDAADSSLERKRNV